MLLFAYAAQLDGSPDSSKMSNWAGRLGHHMR
jgi:hypothetical protein